MGNIDLNNKAFRDKLDDYSAAFDIDPLDLALAQIQFNLLTKLEREVPEEGDFSMVIEKYDSEDPTLKVGNLKIVCKHNAKSSSNNSRSLEIIVADKKGKDNYRYTLGEGNKSEILGLVQSKSFVWTSKSVVNNVDKMIK